MLSITDLTGSSEPLTNIQNCEIEEEVNGGFTLSLTSFALNNPGYDLLQEETYIDVDGHEFRVKNIGRVRTGKPVRGQHIFFDLIRHNVEGIHGGTRTAEEQAAFILNGSGWTWEVQGDIPPQLFLDAFGNNNAVALIRTMCETLKCEVQIMPNKHLIFAKEIGKDEDHQFRYKHNIKSLKEEIDTTDLYTCIKGYGSQGLEVVYKAPSAQKYGDIYADPIYDDNFTVAADLIEHIKQQLGDRAVPRISIDVEVSEMNANGYKGKAGLGDRVWLIHEEMDMEFQTRVMKRKYNPLKKGREIVTLSNVKPTFSDVLVETKVELDKNKKEYRSKIEQVNDRITLQVERLDGEILDAYSRIQLEAERVTIEVARLDGELVAANSRITQTAESIRLDINRIDDDMNTLETQVQFNAGEISSKVSQTDYNGNEMISRINQTATTITMNASKIDLIGIVRVNDSLELGYSGNGQTKAIKFNGHDAWIYSEGDFGLTLDASYLYFLGHTADFSNVNNIIWGSHRPVIDRFNQDLELYIDNATGRLVVYKNGSNIGSVELS
ncbi:phage tail protein [Bacillus sp. Hm123]|uniref:phage tail protein n=1 Tax=Bacillus sp. Hm123 TaxID=3450745 RepID=UPI003F430B90